MFQKLCQFIAVAQSFSLFKTIYLDGSFVTDKPSPSDIDSVLEMLNPNDFGKLLARPDREAILNAKTVKATYGIHLFLQPVMVNFFQHLKPEEAILRKVDIATMRGILRVPI